LVVSHEQKTPRGGGALVSCSPEDRFSERGESNPRHELGNRTSYFYIGIYALIKHASCLRELLRSMLSMQFVNHLSTVHKIRGVRKKLANLDFFLTWGYTWSMDMKSSEKRQVPEHVREAARLLRAIPSKRRSDQSRINGRKGGRPRIK